MLSWHFVTRAAYDAATDAEKTAEKLYFISDTHEIYRGTVLFNESITMYETLPTAPAVGRLYIDQATLEGKVWNGNAWSTAIKPVAATVTADGANPVSGAAVATYVGEKIAEVTGSATVVTGISYNDTTKVLTATKGDGSTTPITLSKLGVDLSYNSSTGALQLKDITGTAIGTAINLDLERFVTAADYDPTTKKITLYFDAAKTDKIEIDVSDLVDTYTVADTSTVDLTMDKNNITAAVKVSAADANIIQVKTDGIYASIDLSGKMDLVASAKAGDIATLNAAGQVVDSGKAAGTATLAATPNANTLATEAAVAAVRTALEALIDGKVAKMGAGAADKVVLSTADGQVARSAAALGGATLNATPDAATLATEAAVKAYADSVGNTKVAKTDIATTLAATSAAASDAKVASEKVVVSALEWKTTV